MYKFFILLSFFFSVLFPLNSSAHFNLDTKIRTIHIVHTEQGLEVFMRLPTPLFLASLAQFDESGNNVVAAPFTYNQIESEVLMHYLDFEKIRKNPMNFGQLVADGLHFELDEYRLTPEVQDVRIHYVLDQPPFASLEEAKNSFNSKSVIESGEEIYVGETVTDVHLINRHDSPINSFSLQSTFTPNLPEQEMLANLILDYYPGRTRVFRLTGLLNDPVTIENSELAAIATFVVQGVKHILEGLDHVLFVVCLALGALSLVGVLWRVTGFTIGHTVTLIAGFLGYVPNGLWFIPTVELIIALSIIFVAVVSLQSGRTKQGVHKTFFVTTFIGLFHGFGFSFVLHEILLPNSAHLWKSLLAFNVGVEIGQVAIVIVIWLMVVLSSRYVPVLFNFLRWAIALPCIIIASYWCVERSQLILQAFSG